MKKRFLVMCVVIAAGALFIAVSVVAFHYVFSSSPQSLPHNVYRYGIPTNLILEEPPVRAGAKISNPVTAIGDEVEVIVLVWYLRGGMDASGEELKDISFDPFEVRKVEITREPEDADGAFVAATYRIQCVTCIPGLAYPIKPLSITLTLPDGTIVRREVFVSPGRIAVDFRYNQEYLDPAPRGIKETETISTYFLPGSILVGGGMIMGSTVFLGGVFRVVRWVMRRKKKVSGNPFVRELSDVVVLLLRRFLENDTDTRRIVHDIYFALNRFMYKMYAIDLMGESAAFPEGIPEDVKRVILICESLYHRDPLARQDVEEVFALVHGVVRWYDEGGGKTCPR